MGFLLPEMKNVKAFYDFKQFLPTSYKGFDELKEMAQRYQLEEHPLLIIVISAPANQIWTEEPLMAKLKEATTQIKNLKFVKSVRSIANREGLINDKESIRIGPLIDVINSSQWKKVFQKDNLVTPILLNEKQDSALIAVEVLATEISDIENLIQSAEKEVEKIIPGVLIRSGGVPIIQTSVKRLLESELFRFIALSLLASLGLVILLFANIWSWFITIYVLAVSNFFAVATMVKMGWAFTALTVTVPILVTVTVLSNIVHTYFRIAECVRNKKWSNGSLKGNNNGAANSTKENSNELWKSIFNLNKDLVLPNLLSNLTTSVGFWTLSWSEIPVISNYGKVVSLCIMISWLFSSISIFPFLFIIESPRPRAWTHFKMKKIFIVLAHYKKISLFIIAVSIVMALGVSHLDWGAKLFDDLPDNHPSRTSTELIDKNFGGLIPLNIEIALSEEDNFNRLENFKKLEEFVKHIYTFPEVGHIISAVDFIKMMGTESEIPKSDAALSEIFFVYSLSEKNPLRNYISANQSKSRVSVKLRDVPGNQMIQVGEKIKKFGNSLFPSAKIIITGTGSHMHPINNAVSKELMFGFWQAMLLIMIALAFVFRSLKWAVISCIPNIVPPCVLFGLLSVTGTAIKPGLALIFSISLGLAFNNTVFLLSQLKTFVKKGRRARVVEHLVRSEGKACLYATLVVLSGFTVFLGAQFSINRTFGVFMLISILAGMVGDLVLLPCLLKWFPNLIWTNDSEVKKVTH